MVPFQVGLLAAVVITAIFYSASAAVPTVPPATGFTACNTSSFTCPPNSHCNIFNPCRYGRQCYCDDGYKDYSTYNSTLQKYIYSCIPATSQLGDSCLSYASTSRCMGTNTYCYFYNSSLPTGTCVCAPGYTPNSDGRDCTAPPTPAIGGNCSYVSCGFGATCVNSICKCIPGYKAFNSTHCTHYIPDDTCTTTTECDFYSCTLGTCKTGRYQCVAGLKWISWHPYNDTAIVDGTCVPKSVFLVGPGAYCGSNPLTSDRYCGYGMSCSTCPEATGLSVCVGYGSGAT